MTITTARPTRRTLVRGAAWSVPVVSIAAAAPAFAASASASLTPGPAHKWGKDANNLWHVSWDFTLTNGAKEIDTISITFKYVPAMEDRGFQTFAIRGYNPVDTTWTYVIHPTATPGEYTVTATHAANIAAGAVNQIHVDFSGPNSNSAGDISATGTVTYADGTTSPLTVPAFPWNPGNEHVGH